VSQSGRLALVFCGLALAAVLAACGSNAASSGPGASGVAASLPPGTYAVEAKEYAFTPSSLSIPAGDVTFRVHNAGSQEHEFEIFKGETVVDEIEGLVPGLTLELKVPAADLPPGEYTFKCKLNGHDTLGMTGTLTVTGS
jgi:plastocyanin